LSERSELLTKLSPPEPPIRAELFGIERLEQQAASLAVAQQVTQVSGRGRPLLARVEDNGRVLRDSYRVVATAVREERTITPAAEWLVDNFHVVDEQLREIRDDLPPGFYRELPKLGDGHLAGYPRVYGIAWAFVAHTDSRFDPDALRHWRHAPLLPRTARRPPALIPSRSLGRRSFRTLRGSAAAVAGVARASEEPRPGPDRAGFLHRAHGDLSSPVRARGAEPRPAPAGAFQRHGASDRGMDCATTH
jgi:hypothetical protein